VKKSNCAGLAQEIGFSIFLHQIRAACRGWWKEQVEGATQLCTSKKGCNKLDLTSAEYL
jgi:hypothetical protein